ncbi:MAG: discoidin domain-containing protein [Gammaproteobacteria bacterium]|nr:discoidin domain-containing protein [Gammaproteobacteria bacterium]
MAFHIGYKNLLTTTGVTVTASTEGTGFEKENAYDGFGFDWWKPTATGDSWIKASFASAQSVDYVAIMWHDLSDHSSSYKLQYSDDDISYFDSFTAVSPSDNNTIYKSFTSSSHKYWRVLINSATTLPVIGGVLLGDTLAMPHGAEVGFAVPTLAPKIDTKTAQSELGAFIGGSQLRQGIDGNINFTNIDPAWVRTNWEPFIEHVQTPAVVVMQWDTVTYTDEIMFAWADGQVTKPSYSSPLYMNFSLKFEGTK